MSADPGGAGQRLARVRRAAGVPVGAVLERVPSYANEVWVGSELVVRLNDRADGSLAREAAVAARLPEEVRYPEILGHGTAGELSWMVTRRVAGVPLGAAWPTLDRGQRERAVRELAGALSALHAVPTDGLPGDADLSPPHILPLERLCELADRVAARGLEPRASGVVDAGAALSEIRTIPTSRTIRTESAAARFARERWATFQSAPYVLVHGDPHLENVLWDGARVSAILDLEWSRRSWAEVDLEILLSICDDPALFATLRPEALSPDQFAEVPRWLEAAAPAWFASPRLGDRLDVLRLSRTLGCIAEAGETAPFRIEHLRDILSGAGPFQRWR